MDKVHIVDSDQNIQAETIPVNSEPDLYNDRFYFWYSSNRIHSTQGGYSGRLLNGNYKEFYPGKALKEEGYFKEGLKDGIWKSWNEYGNLVEQYTWKKGLLSGKFIRCDEKAISGNPANTEMEFCWPGIPFRYGRNWNFLKRTKPFLLPNPD
jgi:antitoxin component YwqK of YwqJK toxin-antitoxin module